MTTPVTLLGSGQIFIVLAINEQGQVLVEAGGLWQNGVTTQAGPGENGSLNNEGEIVGLTQDGQAASFQNGVTTLLPLGFASGYSYAQSVNDSGVAVGAAFTDVNNDLFQAVEWKPGQQGIVLPGLGGAKSLANSINDTGEIVGFATTAAGENHAAAWIDGAVTDLGTLPGDETSLAQAVNQSGEVVGISGGHSAFAWIGGKMTDLGKLPGNDSAGANAVNAAGIVVGESQATGKPPHAVAWINGGIVDLNSLIDPNSGWLLEQAYSINDHNQIAGTGTYQGVSAGFLLTLPGDAAPVLTAAAALQSAGAWIAGTSVGDSAANLAANLDGLQSLVAAGKLSAIALTDSGAPNLIITQAQFSADAAALADISSAHSVTVQMSGSAADYNPASGSAAGATALQFSDRTLIVAQTPGATTVTTGNVTELYSAVFAREPDVAGLAFYQSYLKAHPGTPLLQFAEWFLASGEYTTNNAHAYAMTPAGEAQFITDTYQNLLNRTPTADEVSFYQTKVLDPVLAGLTGGTPAYANAQAQAHAQMLVYFAASAEFLKDVQVTAIQPADAQHWLVLT